MRPFQTLLSILTCILVTSAVQPLKAQNDEAIRKKHFNTEKQLAIQGYDPVTYFTVKKAVKGSKVNTYTYKDITYYFSSTSTLEIFKKDPARYEPAYGGWCAYAMGESGEKVEIDPQTFKIKDGRLYLFYNAFFNNTLPKWNKDEASLYSKAEKNWAKFVSK
jgi:YHS domain-containing protein